MSTTPIAEAEEGPPTQLEVLFGVGFGGGDALERFVEDTDDPLLFGERLGAIPFFWTDLALAFPSGRAAGRRAKPRIMKTPPDLSDDFVRDVLNTTPEALRALYEERQPIEERAPQVGDLANSTDHAYSALPDRLYLVDRDGRVAYRSEPGPWGFKIEELETAMASLLGAGR